MISELQKFKLVPTAFLVVNELPYAFFHGPSGPKAQFILDLGSGVTEVRCVRLPFLRGKHTVLMVFPYRNLNSLETASAIEILGIIHSFY